QMFDTLLFLSLADNLYRRLSNRLRVLDLRFELGGSPFSDNLIRIAFWKNHCLHGQFLTLDFQGSEESCPASGISVKDKNCVSGEIFQGAHLLGAQFSSQKADGIFETRLMESQNIEITFDHKNGGVRNSELFQAEQELPLVEDGGIRRVYVLSLRRGMDC